jgi:hypothetical protein
MQCGGSAHEKTGLFQGGTFFHPARQGRSLRASRTHQISDGFTNLVTFGGLARAHLSRWRQPWRFVDCAHRSTDRGRARG